MAEKPLKAAEALKKASSAEKRGDREAALALYQAVLVRFPGNPSAKRGVRRLDQNVLTGPSESELSFNREGRVGQSSAMNLSGLANPLAVPASRAHQTADATIGSRAATSDPDTLVAQGRRAFEDGRFELAAQLLEGAVKAGRETAEILNDLALSLQHTGRFDDAAKVFERAIEVAPAEVMLRSNLGRMLNQADRVSEAIEVYESALRVMPEEATLWSGKGTAVGNLGSRDDALSCFSKAISLQPSYGVAYMHFMALRRIVGEEPELQTLRDGIAKQAFSERDEIYARFALGKAEEDLGNIRAAFENYARANSLAGRHVHFDLEAEKAKFARLKQIYDPKTCARLHLPEVMDSSLCPVFVIGLPRCGSTLIEQVLDSHSQVQGIGELSVLTSMSDHVLQQFEVSNQSLDKETIKGLRQTYLNELRKLAGSAQVVVDKNLLNFKNVGLIAAAFPEAKILHICRDPMAVCWSMYKRSFAGADLAFAYDLGDLADYYHLYRDMMRHWEDVLPGRVKMINYEAFTGNPEEETKALLDACGLRFEEQTLSFHKNKRAVKTASMMQVRKEIYQGSSEAWRDFEEHLAVLQNKLEAQ
ncbi:Flp pilus assembly protein TadD [Shimia isoporae]|uniref:Flp pilus assembly protein TadD n=1 Tax=Shimia isoporae TaxID=647720 RepID=A0A4R1NLT4_9RHOB|nr:sulfotransferase family protein [Shimia isoporae]TCL09346.1 Flp pilus assembly protein TadD [Shimia isoporae]